MQLSYLDAEAAGHETELLAVGVVQGSGCADDPLAALDKALHGALKGSFDAGDMRGRATDEVLLYGSGSGP